MSAFRQRFWACELRPGGAGSGAAAAAAPPPLPSGVQRSRWQVLKQGSEEYVGETLNGLRHGGGALLTQARRWDGPSGGGRRARRRLRFVPAERSRRR